MAMTLLERVQKLIDIAERDTTPVGEAQNARILADKLMLDHAIEESMLDRTRPAASRMKPATVEVPMVADWELIGYIDYLLSQVSAHCRCRHRSYTSYKEGAYQAKVYGFESDLRYFEMLYTTLRLHMVGVLRPGFDPSKSLDENVYILHHSGLNWLNIAELEGWVEITPKGIKNPVYRFKSTGEEANWAKTIGRLKKAYKRELDRRGEQWLKITPAGVKTFQRNSADGYVHRIAQRLREIRERNPVGSELALRISEVDDMFRSENEDLFRKPEPSNAKGRTRRVRTIHVPYNSTAYQSGVARANTANLNPAASHGTRRGIE